MNLEGNTILITGGASGIGLELAKAFLTLKNTVVITGRDAAKLERAQRQLPGLHVLQSDVSRPEDIEAILSRMLKDFPALNVLVNNAGTMRVVNVHADDANLEECTQEIDTNFKGPVRMIHSFLPVLKKCASAAIINVSSSLAFVPMPQMPVYCASKAALHSFTLSLRAQLENTRVKVFEIAPPTTQTGMLHQFDASDLDGVPIMKAEEMVRLSLRGLAEDRYEIRPGQSNQLKLMSRLAPEFILGQLSKPMQRMLAKESSPERF